jgi:hypothetical protein
MKVVEPRMRLESYGSSPWEELQQHRAATHRVEIGAKVRTDKLQPVIDAALLVAERGRGP